MIVVDASAAFAIRAKYKLQVWMRDFFATVAALTFLTGCSMALANEQLASALEQAGYFSDLSASEAIALRAAITNDGFVGAQDHPSRTALTDSEALAEGGVEEWLRQDINPLLTARGIAFPEIENRFPEDASGYSVIVDGREYWMWREGQAEDSWGTSTVAAFLLVNDLLQQSGAPERLHLLGGGNDGNAWLLTPEQAQILRDMGRVEKREWPYIPVDDGTDYFGQPH